MESVARLLEAHAIVAGDPAAAESICRDVVALEPENGFALHLLGVLRLKHGPAAEAQALLRRAVASRPDNLESRIALAEAFAQGGDDAAACGELGSVLTVRPRHAAALGALSVLRLRLGEPEAALDFAERAHAADPEAVEPLVALGTALSALHRSPEARAFLTAAINRDPDHARAHLNLGNVLLDLDQDAAAERHLRRALELHPQSAEAWASLGFLLAGMDRLEDAVDACDTAVALRPEFPQAYWNRSFARLRGGDFAPGWADYEWRHRHPRFGQGAHILPGREWDGGELDGCRLLVNATQGLGDTIQLARYLPLLAARGAAVTLCCPETLFGLFEQLPVRLIRRGEALPAYDLWIDQMSLPGRFATSVASIPAASGYLRAPPPEFGAPGLQVGLVCAGNPSHSNDFRRSMTPQHLAPLRQVPGLSFTSLQIGPVGADLARLFDVQDNSWALHDMQATARVVASLDLVLSVDTAVAHLAGALGREVWILLPRAPDWRWLAGREDSPWYASARLFRQERAGDWAGVVQRVAEALSLRADRRSRTADYCAGGAGAGVPAGGVLGCAAF